MSLIDSMTSECTLLDEITVTDGRGGYVRRWVDGATIMAAITIDGSTEMKIAQAQGVKAIYTITTTKAVNLQYHDVLRRESDNKIFRVTSDGDDSKTPPTAGLDMRVVTAEEWALPADSE